MRSRLNGTMLIAIALTLIAGATVAMASNHDDVYFACLTSGGSLGNVTVNEAPDCSGNKTLIQWNEAGQPGQDGAIGPQGPPGGLDGTIVQRIDSVDAASGQQTSARAQCDAGDTLISGGFGYAGNFPDGQVTFAQSRPDLPTPDNQAWFVVVRNDTGQPVETVAYALCLKTS
jgi:hypothetical protein